LRPRSETKDFAMLWPPVCGSTKLGTSGNLDAMGEGISSSMSVDQDFEGVYGALCSTDLILPALYCSKAALCRGGAHSKQSGSSRRRPADTLFIFDWDDTLLCSSALNTGRWTLGQLRQLERAAEAVLRAALALGETVIVTNGNETWVQDSMSRFLPGLAPMLDQIAVFSARATYENLYPGDPITWKRLAFKELLLGRQECNKSASCDVNLIAIGDSVAEIQAARCAAGILSGPSLVKTVKLKDAPSVNELVGQLRRVGQELDAFVQDDHSFGKGLVQRALPARAYLDYLASWSSGWRTVASA